MAFYELSKEERIEIVKKINRELLHFLKTKAYKNLIVYFQDTDTYIRKSAYLSIGRIYGDHPVLHPSILAMLHQLIREENFLIRQSVINAAGEIGKVDFEIVKPIFDEGLTDVHHSPRNAVIGSIKKMAQVNPKPVLKWAKTYLKHPNREIRREICHGIELRGRTHPQDILPLLALLQHDQTTRVRNTLIHVIGQISYKKNCLQTVVSTLKTWQNKQLVKEALDEIIDVHYRYRNFSFLTQEETMRYITEHF